MTKLPAEFTLSGNEFHRVGMVTEKDLDPIYLYFTLGQKRQSELDDQNFCIEYLSGLNYSHIR